MKSRGRTCRLLGFPPEKVVRKPVFFVVVALVLVLILVKGPSRQKCKRLGSELPHSILAARILPRYPVQFLQKPSPPMFNLEQVISICLIQVEVSAVAYRRTSEVFSSISMPALWDPGHGQAEASLSLAAGGCAPPLAAATPPAARVSTHPPLPSPRNLWESLSAEGPFPISSLLWLCAILATLLLF